LDPDGRCVEGMVTGQSYNIPSYAGALMGRMNPFFSTTQQLYSTAQTYNANYETFGESHWNAINTTFNPAYAMIKGGYEATTGFGVSPNNLGQDLSVRQRIGSGVESVLGAVGTFGIAEGASLVNGTVGSAFASSAAAELTPFETGAAWAEYKTGSSTTYGPMNPGPLATDIMDTFRSGSYTARTLNQPTTLYRVIGEHGNPLGQYWTSVKPQGPLQSIIDFALDQNWGNQATKVITAKIPAGVRLYEGTAAVQGGLIGGGNQIYIPKVNPNWLNF